MTVKRDMSQKPERKPSSQLQIFSLPSTTFSTADLPGGRAWLERAKKKKSRASLRTFVTTLRAHNARRALDFVTATAPQAWKQS